MSRPEPLKFTLGVNDFDASLLPADSRQVGSERFERAVRDFYRQQFAPLGGNVEVVVDRDTIEVTWEPGGAEQGLLDQALELLQSGQLARAVPYLQMLLAAD